MDLKHASGFTSEEYEKELHDRLAYVTNEELAEWDERETWLERCVRQEDLMVEFVRLEYPELDYKMVGRLACDLVCQATYFLRDMTEPKKLTYEEACYLVGTEKALCDSPGK